MQLLLLIGRLHCKADVPATALPYLLAAHLHATQFSLHSLVR